MFPATVVVSQYEMRSGLLTESHSSFQYHCERKDVHVTAVSRNIVYVNFHVWFDLLCIIKLVASTYKIAIFLHKSAWLLHAD